MDETEADEYRRLAARDGLTLFRVGPSESCAGPNGTKPRATSIGSSPAIRPAAAIRAAARHDFPAADIDRMLREIESGYRA